MLRYIFYSFIIIGISLVMYQYGTESSRGSKTVNQISENDENPSLNPDNYYVDRQFNRMFIDTSVWNNYDTSSINKIYKYKDLDNINVTL